MNSRFRLQHASAIFASLSDWKRAFERSEHSRSPNDGLSGLEPAAFARGWWIGRCWSRKHIN